ncbi:MAG: STAS domain-containing protein [Desulfobacterales bacterium]
MECKSDKTGEMVVIKPIGRMDANTSSVFEAECGKWIEKGEKRLIADLAGLEYISSAGLRSVLVVGKKLKPMGGELVLCNMDGMVEEVFNMSGFNNIFNIFDTLEAALEE